MWNTIKEFWVRYRVYTLENKLRGTRKERERLKRRAEKLAAKYEKYRARLG